MWKGGQTINHRQAPNLDVGVSFTKYQHTPFPSDLIAAYAAPPKGSYDMLNKHAVTLQIQLPFFSASLAGLKSAMADHPDNYVYQCVVVNSFETPVLDIPTSWPIYPPHGPTQVLDTYLHIPDVNTLVERPAGNMFSIGAKCNAVHWFLVASQLVHAGSPFDIPKTHGRVK